jgi:putative chitinase
MPITQRNGDPLDSTNIPLSNGPYLAKVVNNNDTTYMGGLHVTLIKKDGTSNSDLPSNAIHARYLNPFYGVSDASYNGGDPRKFEDVQKSHGMWMVTPEIGTKVLVIFVEGDIKQGYWIGCVPETYQNHMIPGIAASDKVYLNQEQRAKYGDVNYLPVAEFSRTVAHDNIVPSSQQRPVHPFADRLLEQGLLKDLIRGVTSSSARREIPSKIFGISTPGPLDPKGRKGTVGNNEQKVSVPVTRLGGSQFVMDDGDENGQNELVRIRTRTGHQILMHNTNDLIYIANSKGTAWIELTSNGKIDIYAHDSVSIHTENDFNFKAERDINLEAGRNFNVRAVGNMETNVAGFYNLLVDDYAKISIKNNKDESVGGDLKITVDNNMHLKTKTGDIKQTAGANIHNYASANYYATAIQINQNATPAQKADSALIPTQLPLYSLPNRQVASGWANGKFYKAAPLTSIMQRAPTHEPWDQHESISPDTFTPSNTDVTQQSRSSSGIPSNIELSGFASTNYPAVVEGTCDPKFASKIADPVSQNGINALKSAAATLGLTGKQALASLLGVCGGESLWRPLQASYNYSADRLLQVFPSIFRGDQELANQYAYNSSALVPFIYDPPPAGAPGNKSKILGNTQPGDGNSFVDRGYIQLTGRSNYTRYSKILFQKGILKNETDLVDNPLLALDVNIGAAIAVAYLLDRVSLDQEDPAYFNAAVRAVGYCTPDIYNTKLGFYQCFLMQLQNKSTTTGPQTTLTNSAGDPLTTNTVATTVGLGT